MTDRQKMIYNMYLQASSLGVGHPFRMRKDFNGFEESNPEEYSAILRLEKLFDELPSLNMYDYFSSPYLYYKDNMNRKLPLKWYLSIPAMKAYKSQFFSKFEHNIIDDKETQDRISGMFDMIAKRIKDGYPLKSLLKTKDGFTPPSWVQLYSKNFIDDWFLIAFKLLKKDLVNELDSVMRDCIVSVDSIDFIEKNTFNLGNPLNFRYKHFLTSQVKKLVDAEHERNKSEGLDNTASI